jgi:replicative DNA helicase
MAFAAQYQSASVVPQNANSEKAVLFDLARNTSKLFIEQLTTDHFADARNKAIFLALKTFVDRTQAESASAADIVNFAMAKGKLDIAGGEAYISEVIEPVKGHQNSYIENAWKYVKENALQRKVMKAAENIQRGIIGKSVEEIMVLINDEMEKATSITTATKTKTTDDICDNIINSWMDFQKNKKNTGLMTGIEPIDNFLQGIKPCYFVLGAQSSVGKTALCCSVFYNLVSQGKKCIFFSQEMVGESIIQRVAARESGVGVGATSSGVMTAEDHKAAVSAMLEIREVLRDNCEIYDNSNMTVAEIRAKSMAFKRKHGRIDAIFVDYIQSIDIDGFSASNEAAKVQEVSKKLKGIGKDLGCLMFALSQITMEDPSAEPTPLMLRGSRQIMQDADIILLLNRLQHRNERPDNCDILKANFAKGRSTGESVVELKFSPKYMTFGWNVNHAPYDPNAKWEDQ